MAKTKAELLEKQKAANEAKQRMAMAKRKTMEESSAALIPPGTGAAETPNTATKKLKADAPPFTPTSTAPKPAEQKDEKLEKKRSDEIAASFLVDVPPGKNTEEKEEGEAEEGEAEEGELELPSAPAAEKKKHQHQQQQRTPGSQKKGGRGGGQGRGGGRGNKFNNSGKKGGRGNK